MSSFIPPPPNAAWQQPFDLNDEELLEQEEIAYEDELKTMYMHDANNNFGIECRDGDYQEDEELEEADEYDDGQQQLQGEEDTMEAQM